MSQIVQRLLSRVFDSSDKTKSVLDRSPRIVPSNARMVGLMPLGKFIGAQSLEGQHLTPKKVPQIIILNARFIPRFWIEEELCGGCDSSAAVPRGIPVYTEEFCYANWIPPAIFCR